ncbi:lytic murein transglycosylase, putative [Pseudooceanicola batsensis HTCC2597]|uniref:Lytic murein transglycosylase, putative n=1 Tax=Pseudooceanicola batsensis (strain ATCC BAA-863 / DSM 15984 / KCTC 12145 / HTCC2597) TaxID=252305 RepID=A3U2G4_PSEBH|nr:lytic murein transglycosylase [Pseudooceanicola batsensis]EAQ01764.1 lytic murein transglycosylase, putative [Pseudooceanicola batsensis HTCC2597]
MRRLALALILTLAAGQSVAAPCGDTSRGFETWKAAFAQEAARAGVGQRGLQALAGVRYSQGTIAADRRQTGVRYSLQDFMRIRGVDAIVSGGRKRKAANPAFYASIERIYGVPAGILLAIHGMESGFGSGFGKYHVLSSNATVAYDCRRSDFFSGHLIAALKLVDRGWLDPNAIGAAHGEIGHTQFLAGNVLEYGRDGNGDGRVDLYNLSDAMVSTAHFLRQKGWRPGRPYAEGTRNFRVLNEWNAATVYQQAIAIAAARIDG